MSMVLYAVDATGRLHVCALHKESQGQCTVTGVSHCTLEKLVSFCINLC